MSVSDEKKLIQILKNSSEYKKKQTLHFQKTYPEFNTSSKSNFLIIGNCQTIPIGQLIEAMLPGSQSISIELISKNVDALQNGFLDIAKHIEQSTYIIIHKNQFTQSIFEKYPHAKLKVKCVPAISFPAFHPDMGYINTPSGEHLTGAMGDYHSMLCFHGWRSGLSIEETIALFNEHTYRSLGYFDYTASSKEFLNTIGKNIGFPTNKLLEEWLKKGCFMHSLNHPKLFVLADIVRTLLASLKIEYLPEAENYLPDPLSSNPCWPIYPEIAKQFALTGHYYFKQGKGKSHPDHPVSMINLHDLIKLSFDLYAKHDKSELICPQVESERFKNLKNLFRSQKSDSHPVKKINPYHNLQDYQFWRRAIEKPAMSDVDPVVRARFVLNRSDKVATAGSCFAQHISRTLTKNGFNYYVVESGEELAQTEASRRNYGVFSARYGNIYTSRQLLQLFDRAYGRFNPIENAWQRDDGRYADPFRPQIEPDGYASIEELEQARSTHLAQVRQLFETMDVFVFTLGLTESWRSLADGAVFPLAPGVVAGSMDFERYEFVNFEVHEIIQDMQDFMGRLETVNPHCKVILTVSPVPLIATYENRHILTSTTYSKSALRAAADFLVRRYSVCEYFPSYEIITGNYTHSKYYEDDLRSVRTEGVDHVMRLFLKHFSSDNSNQENTCKIDNELMEEAARINAIVCDEEALDSE